MYSLFSLSLSLYLCILCVRLVQSPFHSRISFQFFFINLALALPLPFLLRNAAHTNTHLDSLSAALPFVCVCVLRTPVCLCLRMCMRDLVSTVYIARVLGDYPWNPFQIIYFLKNNPENKEKKLTIEWFCKLFFGYIFSFLSRGWEQEGTRKIFITTHVQV